MRTTSLPRPTALRALARLLDVLVVPTVGLLMASCAVFSMSASLLAAVGCFVVLGVRLVIAGLSRDTSMQRVVLATALAVGGAWSSVAWNTGCVEGVPVRSWSTWRSERFLSATSYETLVVGGWPLQRVEGHGRGGAPQCLMPGKGLGAMQANTAAWFAAVLL